MQRNVKCGTGNTGKRITMSDWEEKVLVICGCIATVGLLICVIMMSIGLLHSIGWI